ncbi:ATP-binding protein [Vibrio cholerae]|uniref:ATP-binding protein n=1 Tax=Vibrio cholerae TaxID=666 RepID=UPI001159D782|nr:ATP-binding protein [Vibrio cholerae]TQO98950.1 AAA family ATPase [Vibrio cholerae]TQP19242.1 AAA family ATPase [Vibrio cholerae]TQQ23029.1 AAA family ATPase [Vibrio cholerae]TQQ42480.1 AAA family ATPase [Vibrio cholerae]TQQ58034.1 AAA family ATPase [Vibrio cholerae]
MIIGVFGLSGVGKTTICSEIHRNVNNVKRISASDVIRMYGNSVKFEMLNQSNVDANQLVLIKGIQQLKEESKLNGGVTTYLLELHNVLETPSGLKEISINIFRQLGLDEAIFLVKPASIIVEQRQKDSQRKRVLATEKELFAIQEQAIMLFNSMFSQLDIPHEVVTNNHVEALTRVIYNSR